MNENCKKEITEFCNKPGKNIQTLNNTSKILGTEEISSIEWLKAFIIVFLSYLLACNTNTLKYYYHISVRPGQVDIKAKRDSLKLSQWNQVYRNQKQNVTISLKSLDDNAEQEKREETVDKVKYNVLVTDLLF